MFNFFCNLLYSIYYGSWVSLPSSTFAGSFESVFNGLPLWNMFNNSTSNTSVLYASDIINALCFVISIICCVCVFCLIVNAIKKIFGCFLEWF